VLDIFRLEPRRLRLDQFPTPRRQILGELAAEDPNAFALQVEVATTGARDAHQVEPLLALVEELEGVVPLPVEPLEQIATEIATRAAKDASWAHLLERVATGPAFRRAAWSALGSLAPQLVAHVLQVLAAASSPEEAGAGTRRLLETVPNLDPALIETISVGLIAGQIPIATVEGAPVRVLEKIASNARQLSVPMADELEQSHRLLTEGQAVAEEDLREGLRPIIERAIERAAGNERLQKDYARLLPKPNEIEADLAETTFELSADARAELERLGARLAEETGSLIIELPSADREQARAQFRYLAVLDQRAAAGRESAAEATALIQAYVEALGRSGGAASLITDLFQRGPLVKLALGLSAPTREALLEAALANGLEPSPGWYDDSALGSWLRSAVAGPAQDEPSGPLEVLHGLRRLRVQVDTARADASRIRHDAKQAFLAETKDAFADLEMTIDGYIQLWNALGALGISQVAALGAVIERQHLDSQRHEIVGEAEGECFVVRGAGLLVDGEVITKAQVEAVTP
jgi:hypothetical protein